jgi:hypothetical protein
MYPTFSANENARICQIPPLLIMKKAEKVGYILKLLEYMRQIFTVKTAKTEGATLTLT